MTYYHHQTIRRYVAAMTDLFNDIHIVQYDDVDPTIVTRDTVVPIRFSSTQKAHTFKESEYEKMQADDYNVLPRFSLGLSTLERKAESDTNKHNKVERQDFTDPNNKKMTWTYNSVSYNLNFELNILAKTFTDLTIIVEQILPMFNPSYPLKFKDMEFHDTYRTIPVKLNDVSFDLDVDLDFDSDVRFVNANLSFTIESNLYPPIKDSKIIEHLQVNLT
jgi:hypothetical protein